MTGARVGKKPKQRIIPSLIVAVILAAGLVVSVMTVVNISLGDREIRAVEQENRELRANVDNLRLAVNRYHNLPEIENRATQLGLARPTEEQIRKVTMSIE